MKGRNNNNSHGNQKRQKKAQKAHEVQGKRKACARVCLCEKKKKKRLVKKVNVLAWHTYL
jgi:hypothetical protein